MIKTLTLNDYKSLYTIRKISFYSPYAFVVIKGKSNRLLIHKNKKVYYINDNADTYYFDDDMNKYFELNAIQGISNELENEILNLK